MIYCCIIAGVVTNIEILRGKQMKKLNELCSQELETVVGGTCRCYCKNGGSKVDLGTIYSYQDCGESCKKMGMQIDNCM